MASEGQQKRLSAILAADVSGYTRLVEQDTDGTVTAWQDACSGTVDPVLSEYSGRIVKRTGDGFLAEFSTVQDAVNCAIAMQEGLFACPLDFRMGVNLGDVVDDGEDIHGEGVNIAARIEALAEPGGICITGSVFEQVRNRIAHGFVDMGEHAVKHVSAPVRVYAVAFDNRPTEKTSGDAVMTEKPSVVVLPFDNMSNDPEQEYFADGLTEDIITELSRFQTFFVIARQSAFAYKGHRVTVQDIGRELGVHYVAEGSVRKAGDRIRVTVQLVDAADGKHIWAERYDHDVADIFDLQDEVTRSIVAAIPGRLANADLERIGRKPPTNLNAYDFLMRAKLYHHRGGEEDNAEALRLLESAIDLDPGYAAAYGWKGCVLGQAWARGYRKYSVDEYELAVATINRGILEDENDIECVRILCEYRMEDKSFDSAERYSEKALRLNPNDPRIVAQRGELLTWIGRPDEGVDWLRKAGRLDPFSEDNWAHLLGRALFGTRQYELAIKAFERAPKPNYRHTAFMAACCALLTQPHNASSLAAQVLAQKPDFSVTNFVNDLSYKLEDDKAHLLNGMTLAGLPE